MTGTRFLTRTAGIFAVLALASCVGDTTGPEAVRSGRFYFAPVFDVRAVQLVPFDSVRVHLSHLDGSPALDTTIFFPANVDTVTLDLTVPLSALSQQFLLTLSMIDSTGAIVFHAGPDTVVASAGSNPPPVHPPLVYVGHGSNAAGVRFVGTPPSAAFFGDTLPYSAEAFDSQGVTIPNTPIFYSSSDSLKARVLNQGAGPIVAGSQRGSVIITAALLTPKPPITHGLAIQAHPAALVIQGGNSQTGAAGGTLSPLVARVNGTDGLGVQGVPVTFAVTSGGGSLSKLVDTTDANGDARTTWTMGTSVGVQSVSANATGLSPASVSFGATAIAAAAKKLTFSVPPSSVAPGQSIAPAVKVTAQDSFGNTATGFTGNITVALGANPGSATLSGTLTVAAVAGVATFGNLSLNNADTGYTLIATAAGLTGANSGIFNVVGATPASLFISTQPVTTTAAATMPQIQVQVRDALNNVVASDTANITVAIANNPGGGTLSGTTTVKAVAGVATFNGLSIDRAGTGYTLSFTRAGPPSVPAATSNSFDINSGPATVLQFGVQPPAGANFQTPFTVAVKATDAGGNLDPSFNGNVTITIGTNPASGTLFGTQTVAASGGIATFSTLDIDNIGAGYTLTAHGGTLSVGTSNVFNVVAPAGVNAWINTAGGNWGTASNWSKGTVPTATDTVAIAQSGTYTVNLDVSAAPVALGVGAPLGNQVLSVAANVLTLATSNVFTPNAKLSLSGGTIAGTGALTLLGGFDWSGGNLTFAGGIAATSGLVTISGSASSTWTGSVLTIGGAATWTGSGTYNTGLGAGILVLPGGSLDIQGSPFVQFNQGGTAPSLGIVSGGTVTRSTSSGGATLNMLVNNAGTLSLNSGSLSLGGGGASTGAINVASGATLNFTGGTHTLAGTMTDAGQVLVSAGTVSASAWSGAGSVKVQGGTLNADGSSMSVDTLVLGAGAIGGGAGGLMTANKRFTWVGGNLTGTGGTVQVASLANGTIGPAGSVSFTNMTLDLIGPTVWTGTATINTGLGGLILVRAGNTLDIQNAVNINQNQGGTNTQIHNLGTITRTAGIGTAALNVEVDNDGQVTASSGTLQLSNGSGAGTADGVYTAGPGATVEFAGGTHSLGAAGTVAGTGTILVSSGTVNAAGSWNVASLTQVAGGALNYSGASGTTGNLALSAGSLGSTAGSVLNVATNFAWSGGNVAGSGGTIHVNSGGTLAFSTATNRSFTNEIVELAGSGTWTGTAPTFNTGAGAILRVMSGASLDVQGDPAFLQNQGGANSRLEIQSGGTFTRSTSAGGATMDVEVENDGQLTVSSGLLHLALGSGPGTSDGAYTAAAGGLIDFSGGTHALSATSAVNGAGTVQVSSGTVNDAGSWAVTNATNVNNVGVLNYNGASGTTNNLVMSGGTLGGSGLFTVSGTWTWSGGNVVGGNGTTQVLSGGTLNITGAISRAFTSHILENAGATNWNSTFGMNTGIGAIWRNLPTGTFTMAANGSLSQNQGGATTIFENQGTFVYNAAGTTTWSALFNHIGGTVSVSTGTFSLSGGGAESAPVTVTSPATFDFNGNTDTLKNGYAASGTGFVQVQSGSVTTPSAADTARFTNLRINNGSLIQPGGMVVASGTLDWAAGGGITGTGMVRIANTATLTITGTASRAFTNGTILNQGSTAWSGGLIINTGVGAVLRNAPGATFALTASANLTQNLGGTVTIFDNQGSFTSSAPTANWTAFYQDTVGSTSITAGTFNVNNGARLATGTGKSIGTGATFGQTAGTVGFQKGTTFTGAGKYVMAGGTMSPDSNTAAGALAFTNFDLNAGVLANEGLVTVSTTMNWNGGNITSNATGTGGTTRILGNLNILTTATRTFSGPHLLEMDGTNNTWSGAAAPFINTGLGAIMRVQTGATFNVTNTNPTITLNQGGTATFDNLGTVNRNTGTAGFVVNVPVTGNGTWLVSGSGNLDMQGGGTIAGPTTVTSPASILFNNNTWNYTSAAPISGTGTMQVNAGTVNPQGKISIGALNVTGGTLAMGSATPDTILVTGNLATSGTGVINMTNNADSLDIAGNATFGGSAGTMNAGAIRLQGNFTETSAAGFAATAASATVAHRVRLEGSAPSSISFANIGSNFFRQLIVNKSAAVAITLNTNTKTTVFANHGIGGTLTGLNLPPITVLTVDTIYGTTGSMVSPLSIQLNGINRDSGTINVDSMIYAGTNQQISTVGAAGGTVTFQSIRVVQAAGTATFQQNTNLTGGLTVNGGSVSLNGFRIAVPGNFVTAASATLTMQNALDSLGVGGNVVFGGGSTNTLLTNGVITVGGNFVQSTSPQSFAPSGTAHRVSFRGAGPGPQTISFANPTTSHFVRLETVSASRNVNFLTDAVTLDSVHIFAGATPYNVTGSGAGVQRLTVGGVLRMDIQTGSPSLNIPVVELGASPSIANPAGYTADTTVINAAMSLPVQSNIAYKSLRIAANAVTLPPNSTLTIANDLIINSTGQFTMGASSNMTVTGSLITQNSGALNMTASGATLQVNGNATFGGGSTAGLLTAGTLRLLGNFSEGGGSTSAFQAGAGHTTEFNNTAQRTVSMPDFGTGATNSRFGLLRLARSGGPASIKLSTSIQAAMLVDTSLSVADTITGSTGIGVTADSTGNSGNGLGLDNTVFNGATLTLSSGGGPQSLVTIEFRNMDPTSTFLTMFRNGSTNVNISGMNFASAHTTGHYFAGNTVGAGIGAGQFTFLTGSLPASFTAAAGDYTRAGPTLPTVSWNNVTNP